MRKSPIKLNSMQIEDIINFYTVESKSAREIARIFVCDVKTITGILRKHDIKIIRNHSESSKLPESQIIEDYQSGIYTISSLSRKYHTSRTLIYKTLKQNKIEIISNIDLLSKYTLNKYYFDIIDTEDKAYFLGLLYADGNNYTKRGRVSISLQEEDKYIIESFNKQIQSNRKLTLRARQSKNSKHKNQYRLDIVNIYLSEQLNLLGCTNAKSLTLRFPNDKQVPTHLLRHFIRGLWDGDGCISVVSSDSHKRYFRSSITSTFSICQSIQGILKQTFDINSSIRSYKCNDVTKNLDISGFVNNSIFLTWLYKDANFYLSRKMNKYLLGISEANKINLNHSNDVDLNLLAFRPTTATTFNTSRGTY